MDLKQKLQEILRKEYNITTEEELLEAIKNQKQVDIGIFVSPCGGEEEREEAC